MIMSLNPKYESRCMLAVANECNIMLFIHRTQEGAIELHM